jgi:hypothetical protein
MSMFQFFKGKITEIADFTRETTLAYDHYERPAAYCDIKNDSYAASSQPQSLKMLSIQLVDGSIIQCVVDNDILKFEAKAEDNDEGVIHMVFSGKDIAAILNAQSGIYCYYRQPLYRKFSIPKIKTGLYGAIAACVSGYIMHVITLRFHSDILWGGVVGVFATLFTACLVYAFYHSLFHNQAYKGIKSFVKVIEPL